MTQFQKDHTSAARSRPVRAAIYARALDNLSGLSATEKLEAQISRCRRFIGQQKGPWRVIWILTDTTSEVCEDRPGLRRLETLIDAGVVDVVVAATVDRLFRKWATLAWFVERLQALGVGVFFADSRDRAPIESDPLRSGDVNTSQSVS